MPITKVLGAVMGVEQTVKLTFVTDLDRYWKCAKIQAEAPEDFKNRRQPRYATPEVEVYLPGQKNVSGYECTSKLFFNVVPWDPNNPQQSRDLWVCMHMVVWPPVSGVKTVVEQARRLDAEVKEVNLDVRRLIILDDEER